MLLQIRQTVGRPELMRDARRMGFPAIADFLKWLRSWAIRK